jgi:molybdenum cofactor cytidylyltransferase
VILGALLAAGTGSRFEGGNKLLADLEGEPIVAHAARTLTESALDAAVAVVGHESEAVSSALPGEIDVLANPEYRRGQSASVRRTIEAARERDAEAVLFALGDMPRVSVETADAILRTYRTSPLGIVAPRHRNRRGNPVLFDSRYFDALADVAGDRGGRELLESESVERVDVPDPGIHRDVDTEADLQELRSGGHSESDGSGSESSASDGSTSERG